jgi:PEP-CTERM motif-containing protein
MGRTKSILLILAILITLFGATRSWAVPNLQIYIPGATYDADTETWIIDSYDYQLWVVGANLDVEDVKIALAVPTDETGSISLTWLDTASLDPFPGDPQELGTGHSDYGSQGVTSLLLDEAGSMEYGLYRDSYASSDPGDGTFGFGENTTPLMGDGSAVPPHGVFPTDFYEYFIGDFGTDETIYNYVPGEEFGDTASGQIKAFDISVSGYTWVDIVAYNHVILGETKAKYVFSPFSHDGASTPVPEPATMLLLGTGLIGLAGLRRRIGKS